MSVIIKNTYEGTTDQLPEDWHRKLVIALSHDTVTIEGNRFLSDVVLDSDYGIEWEDFLNKPIADAKFTIQVTPFNATNSNCQTCDEITQVELVDDTTEDIFEEGETYDYPTAVIDNDSICCFPFEIEVVSFNTLYFSDVSITDAGILTFTVLPSVPTISNVLIATYRVTCGNGGYDEANIYGNIEGTSAECVAPQELVVTYDESDGTVATVDWDGVLPTPVGYIWSLYLASDIYTPVQTGSEAGLSVYLTGLTEGEDYIFALQTDCGGDLSPITFVEFTTPVTDAENCGSFLVSFSPLDGGIANYSYMDCSGAIVNLTVTTFDSRNICMLMNEVNEPIFFATDSADVIINYQYLC